jgi:transcriptional regulator with XRE-family HTH domain
MGLRGPKPKKIDQRMIHKIKELRSQNMTQEEIACDVGVAQGTVSVVLRAQGLGGKLRL